MGEIFHSLQPWSCGGGVERSLLTSHTWPSSPQYPSTCQDISRHPLFPHPPPPILEECVAFSIMKLIILGSLHYIANLFIHVSV